MLMFSVVSRIARYGLLLGSVSAATVGGIGLSLSLQVQAQQPLPATIVSITSNPRWNDLTETQRNILHPLAPMWDSLEETRKKKWLAVAQSYPTRTPAEQNNIQSRMAEWAALPPAERESARLNFNETKKLPPTQRTAEWEAYQKLSPEEKKVLAGKGNTRPVGAATPVRPASSPKITPVPITRHKPAQEKSASQMKPRIHPHTLLPLTPLPPAKPVHKTPAEPSSKGAVQ
jgi:hypothetical protein